LRKNTKQAVLVLKLKRHNIEYEKKVEKAAEVEKEQKNTDH